MTSRTSSTQTDPLPSKSTETLASAAYERLRMEIITGVFAPGEKLPIRSLCERYGMGLSPIREALNRVSRDGFLRQSDQRGFTVTPLTEQDLVDLTKARCWANEAALRESVRLGDAAWEESIVLAYHRMSRFPPADDAEPHIYPARELAHRAFHRNLIAACGSQWMIGFCEHLFDAADRYRVLSRRNPTVDPRRYDEHRLIMEATLARDAETAVSLLLDHINMTLAKGRIELRRHQEGPAAEAPAAPGGRRSGHRKSHSRKGTGRRTGAERRQAADGD